MTMALVVCSRKAGDGLAVCGITDADAHQFFLCVFRQEKVVCGYSPGGLLGMIDGGRADSNSINIEALWDTARQGSSRENSLTRSASGVDRGCGWLTGPGRLTAG